MLYKVTKYINGNLSLKTSIIFFVVFESSLRAISLNYVDGRMSATLVSISTDKVTELLPFISSFQYVINGALYMCVMTP